MTLPNALHITDGILHLANGDQSRDYLRDWQERHRIPNGGRVVLCPREPAQKVEDFLEALRVLQATREKNASA